MTRSGPYSDLLAALIGLKKDFPTTKWYGFGSFFNSADSFNDIDLLAVCSDGNEAATIRKGLTELAIAWPIHLIVMIEDEAVETDFIVRQGCRLLCDERFECGNLLLFIT